MWWGSQQEENRDAEEPPVRPGDRASQRHVEFLQKFLSRDPGRNFWNTSPPTQRKGSCSQVNPPPILRGICRQMPYPQRFAVGNSEVSESRLGRREAGEAPRSGTRPFRLEALLGLSRVTPFPPSLMKSKVPASSRKSPSTQGNQRARGR